MTVIAEKNPDCVPYYTGWTGSGETMRRMAADLAANRNESGSKQAFEKSGPIARADAAHVDFPMHYNGYAGNGTRMREIAESISRSKRA
ncbi:hypothetical protein [Paenibacillus glycinis]|uniref:Uncharacterized protein n=1 Tax=Paenibacillus glycinis TaxID=2697035 RepID=A0ABW9XYJ2_9BACL|nr:hypothetical protein [Paenibacillus glycinis]NBD27297.1 hypothetical protein [Paenibacillus glycinis]